MVELDDDDENDKQLTDQDWERIYNLEDMLKKQDKEIKQFKNEQIRSIEQIKVQYLGPMMTRIKRLESQMNLK